MYSRIFLVPCGNRIPEKQRIFHFPQPRWEKIDDGICRQGHNGRFRELRWSHAHGLRNEVELRFHLRPERLSAIHEIFIETHQSRRMFNRLCHHRLFGVVMNHIVEIRSSEDDHGRDLQMSQKFSCSIGMYAECSITLFLACGLQHRFFLKGFYRPKYCLMSCGMQMTSYAPECRRIACCCFAETKKKNLHIRDSYTSRAQFLCFAAIRAIPDRGACCVPFPFADFC